MNVLLETPKAILESILEVDAPDTGRVLRAEFFSNSCLSPEAFDSEIRHVFTVESGELTFTEFSYPSPTVVGELPVLFVIDKVAKVARIYSDMAIAPERLPTIGEATTTEIETNPMVALLAAMAQGDIDSITSLFSPNASFAHSSGAAVEGDEALRSEFSGMIGKSGFAMEILTAVSGNDALASECAMPGGRVNAGVYLLDPADESRILTVRTYM